MLKFLSVLNAECSIHDFKHTKSFSHVLWDNTNIIANNRTKRDNCLTFNIIRVLNTLLIFNLGTLNMNKIYRIKREKFVTYSSNLLSTNVSSIISNVAKWKNNADNKVILMIIGTNNLISSRFFFISCHDDFSVFLT